MKASKCRFYDGKDHVGYKCHTKTKKGCPRIAKRVDLRIQMFGKLLKSGLDRPAGSVYIGDLCRLCRFLRQIGDNADITVAITSFLLQSDAATSENVLFTISIDNRYGLFINGTSFGFTDVYFFSNGTGWVIFVFTDNKESPF